MKKSYSILFRKLFSMLILIPYLVSCGSNSFESFEDTTTDEAVYYAALAAVNAQNYTAAVDICTDMSADLLAERRATLICATAFAGRCGFAVLDMVDFITTYFGLGGPPPLFEYMLQQFTGTTAQYMSDCDTAEDLIRTLGEAADRTADENTFMILLSLHKIGVYVNELADATDDAVLDGGFDACTDITDPQATDIAGAFWELKESSAGSVLFADVETAVTAICTALGTYNAAYNFCSSVTFPSAPTADERNGARMLIHEGALIGVNSCGVGTFTFPECPCP